MMRAVQAMEFGPPDVLAPSELPEPAAGPGQVVVGVKFAPVLFLDTQIRAGWGREWFPVTPPYTPGAGVAGEIISVGQGVDPGWLGRRVVADTAEGGYLERAAVQADRVVAIPEALGTAEAAALLHDGRTAMGLVEVAAIRPGECVLVLGAGGGLGILLVQLADGAGARVVGAARGKRKRDLARELGASVVVDYSQPGWPQQALAAAGGTGPDVVFDGVGGEIGQAAFQITARGGRFSAHGAPSGRFAPIDRQEAERRTITVRGIEQAQFADRKSVV